MNMSLEKKRFIYSLAFPLAFLLLIWVLFAFQAEMELSFVRGGVYPRHLSGLPGILFSPLIHGDWKHLLNNSAPLFLLSLALFYFYRDIAYRIWGLVYLIGGLLLWCVGREAYHIGASGLIYGLGAFLFLSGLIRRVRKLMAISLLVVFWYGGMVWGLFPFDTAVSFEAHICGAFSGLMLALVFRDLGPKPDMDLPEDEDELPEDEDELPEDKDELPEDEEEEGMPEHGQDIPENKGG